MADNMINRLDKLTELQTYLKNVDTEVTMILQCLQWDRIQLVEKRNLVSCQYDTNHRVPPDKLEEHEKGCFLKSQGYSEKDRLLPSPINPDADTLVKLNSSNIAEIINKASSDQCSFKKGAGCDGNQPLTLERLQATYTADERRAIHDAVVNRVPSCHDLSDLALLSTNEDATAKESKPKSKMEILAELRNMKRRRAKYRVAAKTRNYSDVLRDVITTQTELYTQVQDNVVRIPKEEQNSDSDTKNNQSRSKETNPSKYQDYNPNRKYRKNEEGHGSRLDQDKSYHAKHLEENRKRRHEDSYYAYKHAKYSKSDDQLGSKFRTTDHDKEDLDIDSNSKRRKDKYTHSFKTHRDLDYQKQKRQKDGSYSRKPQASAVHDYEESTHYTYYKRSLEVKIKKERNDSYNGSSDDGVTEERSQNYDLHQYKVIKERKKQHMDATANKRDSLSHRRRSNSLEREEVIMKTDIYIKKERNASDNSDAEKLKPIDKYHEYGKSKNKQSTTSSLSNTFKEKNRRHDKNNDRKYEGDKRPKDRRDHIPKNDIKVGKSVERDRLHYTSTQNTAALTESYSYNDKQYGREKNRSKYTELDDCEIRRREISDKNKEKYKKKSHRKE